MKQHLHHQTIEEYLIPTTFFLGLFSGPCTPEGRKFLELDSQPSDPTEQEESVLPKQEAE